MRACLWTPHGPVLSTPKSGLTSAGTRVEAPATPLPWAPGAASSELQRRVHPAPPLPPPPPAPGDPARPHCGGSRWRGQGGPWTEGSSAPCWLAADCGGLGPAPPLSEPHLLRQRQECPGPQGGCRDRPLESPPGLGRCSGHPGAASLHGVHWDFTQRASLSLSPQACTIGSDTTRTHRHWHTRRAPKSTHRCLQSQGFANTCTHPRSHTHEPFFLCTRTIHGF